jgi:proline dehydrogenase
MAKPSPLSVLPFTTVIRTLATTTISSSPLLLPPSLAIMKTLAHTTNPILNPDKNPLMRYLLKKTFYAQFCAGENAAEVRRTVSGLKGIGFTGVILGYAREIVLSEQQTNNLSSCDEGPEKEACIRHEIGPWAAGTMETVRLAQPTDFVALKFTGAGRQALYALKNRLPPPADLRAAIDDVCKLAGERNVPLLFDAEQTALQAGIDDWTLEYQRKFNTVPGHAIIYGTYQAYLKSTPATLASHLAAASEEGFTLGVKLVRGAYLGADPRHVIHDTKEDTDRCYDGAAEALIRREWNNILAPASKATENKFPLVSLVLGSHNMESVRRARAVRDSITVPPPTSVPPTRGPVAELAIAQLQGMADEVSCELVCVKKADEARDVQDRNDIVRQAEKEALKKQNTRAYKYIVWGTTGECMKYLLRRAMENKDAVQRTRSGRDAMWGEVKRRVWGALGGRA